MDFLLVPVLALAYVWFMKRYYHLHEEWLKGLGKAEGDTHK